MKKMCKMDPRFHRCRCLAARYKLGLSLSLRWGGGFGCLDWFVVPVTTVWMLSSVNRLQHWFNVHHPNIAPLALTRLRDCAARANLLSKPILWRKIYYADHLRSALDVNGRATTTTMICAIVGGYFVCFLQTRYLGQTLRSPALLPMSGYFY